MTKNILIGIGIGTISLLVLAWAYLFVFGTPDSIQGIMTDLSGNEYTAVTPPEERPSETTVALNDKVFAQLTTRPVAGFTPTETTDGGRGVRYAERGTGHVYDIDLATGKEVRASARTFGQVVAAHFDRTGDWAVMEVESGATTRSYVYSPSGGANPYELPAGSHSFHFDSTGSLNYAVPMRSGTIAYSLDLASGQGSESWRAAFSDIDVRWASPARAFIVNRPTGTQKSGIFLMENGRLETIVAPKFSLSAALAGGGDRLLYTYFESSADAMITLLLDLANGEERSVPFVAIPEKCTTLSTQVFVCASSFELMGDRAALNRWYSGELTSSDTLWREGATTGSATYLDFLSDRAGFVVDVEKIAASADDRTLFFTNKINDALWMYEMRTASTMTETNATSTATSSDAF